MTTHGQVPPAPSSTRRTPMLRRFPGRPGTWFAAFFDAAMVTVAVAVPEAASVTGATLAVISDELGVAMKLIRCKTCAEGFKMWCAILMIGENQ